MVIEQAAPCAVADGENLSQTPETNPFFKSVRTFDKFTQSIQSASDSLVVGVIMVAGFKSVFKKATIQCHLKRSG